MRADPPKDRATQKTRAKDQRKDLGAPAQLQAQSQPDHRPPRGGGQDRVRRRSGEDNTSPTRH